MRQHQFNIAHNEKGLAFVGELAFRLPITEAQYLFKSLNYIQMLNRNSSRLDKRTTDLQQPIETTSAPITPNPMLAAGLTMSNIEKQVIWEDACQTILKDIATTFLSKSNQNKAGLQSDKDVFQAIGETIQNFPIPKFNQILTNFDYVLLEVKDVLIRRFGNDLHLKGMYNDEVIYLDDERNNSIKIRIEVVK